MSHCPGCGRSDVAGITHVCPPIEGDWTPTYEQVSPRDPIRLPDLVRRALAQPRFLSIGSVDNTVEVRMRRDLYDEIAAIVGRPVGE